MLNIHYQLPISILTSLKLKFKQHQLKRSLKKEPFNFNLVEPSEVKPCICRQFELMRILKPVVYRCSTNTRVFKISEKVNRTVKVNTHFLKDTCKYAHY